MRGLRAVVYIEAHLHPLAADLVGDNKLLAWEVVAGQRMKEYVADRKGSQLMAKLRFVHYFLAGTPIIISIAATSVLLAIAGSLVHTRVLTLLIGGSAALFAMVFATYGYAVGRIAGR